MKVPEHRQKSGYKTNKLCLAKEKINKEKRKIHRMRKISVSMLLKKGAKI
jgi:hypothetical protein